MNIKEENGIYSISKQIMAQVVEDTDKVLKNAITEYAQKRAKELGKEIEVLFIDKSIADEIIDLGVKEYMRRKSING